MLDRTTRMCAHVLVDLGCSLTAWIREEYPLWKGKEKLTSLVVQAYVVLHH